MKNHQYGVHISRFLIFTMRITFFVFFLGIMQTYAANTYAQITRLTIRENNIELGKLLSNIEDQTDFYFFYNNDLIDKKMKVNVNVEDKNIYEILSIVLKNKGISYSVNNNTIILNQLTETTNPQQKKTVTGKVFNEMGESVIGANIVEKGTLNGVITDIDGNFSLSVRENAVIQVTYIGYHNQEIAVSGKNTLSITLIEDTQKLDEVVVVAYGTQKKKDLTGAISAIDTKLIGAQSSSSVSKILEGSVPGLQVSSVDGQPGLDMAIRVRGIGSTNIASSGALVVIDGVPQNPDSGRGLNPLASLNPADISNITVLKDAASTALYGSRGANGVVLVTTKKGETGKAKVSFSARWGVNSIGPFNVGKIDNSADYYEFAWKSVYNSYRYGIDGSGLPKGFTSNVKNPNYTHEQAAEFASQHLFNYINSETTFAQNMLGNFMAYNVPNAVYTPDGTGSTHSSTMTEAYLVGLDGRINPNASLLYNDNYSDYLLEDNFRQEYNLSLSGGGEKMSYFLSLGYLEDPSYIKASRYSRYSGRSNVEVTPVKPLKFGVNLGYSKTRTDKMGVKWGVRNAGANQGNAFRFINGHAPIVPVYAYNEDGSYRTHALTGTPYFSTADGTYSPLGPTKANYGGTDILYSINNDENSDVADVLNMRLFGEVSFLNDFKLTLNFFYDKTDVMKTQYVNSKTGFGKDIGGMAKSAMKWDVMNIQEILSYNKDIEKHHIDAMVAHEYSDWVWEMTRFGAGYELIPGFIAAPNFAGKYVNVSSVSTPTYEKEIERMESYLGRANYIYDDKYYLSGSIRGDGSSKFKKNRWGIFWSLGGGWRISNEHFMEGTKNWLDNAKLRFSYGVIGNANAIGRYSGYRTWNYGAKYTETSAGTGTPNGIYTLAPGGFVNDALTWENTNTFDVGLDMTIFRKINLTLDYYNRYTKNSFFNQPVSYMATGQESLQFNGAGIRNEGVEIELGMNIIKTKNFSWDMSVNGTHYTTILESIPEGAISDTPGLPSGTWVANGDGWSAAGTSSVGDGQFYLRGEGRPWYNLFIYKYAGVSQETGLPLYWHRVTESEAGTGEYANNKAGDNIKVLNYNEASKYEVGDAVPKFIGGLSTTLRYKNFDFTGVLAYQIGGKFFSTEYGNGMYRSGAGLNAISLVLSEDLIGNTWTPENTNAKYPMQWYAGSGEYYDGATFGSWKYTDMGLFSASYLRVKNLTFGYTFPGSWLSKAHISNLRLYFSGDNLFMFSAAKGVDPTMSLTGGMEVGAYTFPAMRTISLGINLDF